MGFIIGLLTFVLVLDCLVLVLLVLIQLPKKEAGAGLAFGGGASDALFGAGSGTVLTKITRWFATAFFILALVLAFLQSRYFSSNTSKFQQQLAQPSAPILPPASPSAPPSSQPGTPAPGTPTPLTGSNALLMPQVEATNLHLTPAVPTNTAPAK